MSKFKRGDTVFFIESGFRVVEASVFRVTGSFYDIRFSGLTPGAVAGIRLRENRLYATEEEARAAIRKNK